MHAIYKAKRSVLCLVFSSCGRHNFVQCLLLSGCGCGMGNMGHDFGSNDVVQGRVVDGTGAGPCHRFAGMSLREQVVPGICEAS